MDTLKGGLGRYFCVYISNCYKMNFKNETIDKYVVKRYYNNKGWCLEWKKLLECKSICY